MHQHVPLHDIFPMKPHLTAGVRTRKTCALMAQPMAAEVIGTLEAVRTVFAPQ